MPHPIDSARTDNPAWTPPLDQADRCRCDSSSHGSEQGADFAFCDRCEEPVRPSSTATTVRGSTICIDCRLAHYVRCARCDGLNRVFDPCGSDCEIDDEYDSSADLIASYSYKPAPVFHGSGTVFLGAEIEVDTPYSTLRSSARLATDHLGSLGYLKEDGSIDGFEIVTHPMSYEWALQFFPWPMLSALREAGCEATDATGIHVHVSRSGFSDVCHTYRWMKFIYRNERQVVRLARRRSAQWAAFTDADRRDVKRFAKGGRGERYRAINTSNADTFELRMFAGSLDSGEVQAALAFAAASVEYTRRLTVADIARDGGWTWPAFADWVAQQPQYRPLSEQLEALSCAC